jgi:hypothetical protein
MKNIRWSAILIAAAAAALALPTLASAASLSGKVTASGGEPATSVWLVVSTNGNEVKRSHTGDDGRYYLGGLAAGEYEVTVERGGETVHRAQKRLPAEDSRENLDIRLR